MKEIKQLLIAVGDSTHIVNATEDTPITETLKNGEMAPVIWYEHGKEEFNSKYVISVVYK